MISLDAVDNQTCPDAPAAADDDDDDASTCSYGNGESTRFDFMCIFKGIPLCHRYKPTVITTTVITNRHDKKTRHRPIAR